MILRAYAFIATILLVATLLLTYGFYAVAKEIQDKNRHLNRNLSFLMSTVQMFESQPSQPNFKPQIRDLNPDRPKPGTNYLNSI